MPGLSRMRVRSCGLTLIECLVALGVVALLMSIALPAVQQVRAAAARMECGTHLKQIGLAMGSYEAIHGELPTVRLLTIRHASGDGYAPHARMLPHIDQSALYDTINWELLKIARRYRPLAANRTARTTRVSLYLCPADRPPRGEPGNSYRANLGLYKEARGAFPWVGATERVPGSSATAAFSERVVGSFGTGRPDETRDVYYDGFPGAVLYTTAELRSRCARSSRELWDRAAGRYWLFNSTLETVYYHNALPNAPEPGCIAGEGPIGNVDSGGMFGAKSWHPGSVNVLYLDGRVDAVGSGIDAAVWHRVGTVNNAGHFFPFWKVR